jgi:starch-binding outer membrane protein, SusD/RagB family
MKNLIAPLFLLCSVMVIGCSTLTEADAPDVVQQSALDNPSGAEVLRLGAISRFAAAFAGSAELTQITATGLISDELFSASIGSVTRVDQRLLNDPVPEIYYPYQGLQQTHVNLLQAIDALERISPSRHAQTGQLFALAGYVETFFGENLCSGVPLSPVVDGLPVVGDPLTTSELFDGAVSKFDSAIVHAPDSARFLNLARVGLGRVLLDAGQFDDAATAVASVPTGYVYVTDHSATVQQNGFVAVVNTQKNFTVADREGGNGLNFVSAKDPRVPTALLGKGTDGVTDVYTFGHYTSAASSVVLASGVEARLIEAEVALHGGDTDRFLADLNALRADPMLLSKYAIAPGALPPLAQPASEKERIDLLFRERAMWMFGTGHRHGDLRRLVRQYGRPAESVFPAGTWKSGQVYGSDVNFPPDVGELNNPHYQRCADRDA